MNFSLFRSRHVYVSRSRIIHLHIRREEDGRMMRMNEMDDGRIECNVDLVPMDLS